MKNLPENQPTDALKMRVLAAKPWVISNGDSYVELILNEEPTLNNRHGLSLITNVWNTRLADVRLTEVIERIAERNKQLSMVS